MIALIDGDLLVHRYTSPKDVDRPIEHKGEWFKFPVKRTIAAIDDKIEEIVDNTGASDYRMVFSDPDANFRREILPSYKGHRTARKPIMMKHIVNHYMDDSRGIMKPTLEADDVMGILATRDSEQAFVICSFDKDMRTIPGDHYDFRDPFNEIERVDEREAERLFHRQILTGDSTDGYPGAYRIGPKSADAILDSPEYGERGIAVIRECFDGDDEAFLVNARCARILTADLYDFDQGAPRLWSPDCG